MRKLSDKQKKFCKHYAKDGNGRQAAIKAGYSEKTAKQIANQNLTKVYLKDEIDRQRKIIEKEAIKNGEIITPVELMESYTRDILFDPINLVNDEGRMLPLHKVPKEARMSLTGIEVKETFKTGVNKKTKLLNRETKYKFPTKNQPRDSVAKIFRLMQPNGSGKEIMHEFLVEFFAKITGVNINIQQNNTIIDGDTYQKVIGQLMNAVAAGPRGLPEKPEVIDV